MNVLITGSNGYLGNLLILKLIHNPDIKTIIGVDKKSIKTPIKNEKFIFVQMNYGDKEITRILETYNIDTVIHLASILNPQKNLSREELFNIEVNGTINLLKACVEKSIKRFIYSSSGAAYGYHADNPIPLKEYHPLRGNKEFFYSYHKMMIEKELETYRETYPFMKQFIFRIATILGKNTKNQITQLFDLPFLIGIKGLTSPFCFIWDEDVIKCLEMAIFAPKEKADVYNLAGDGYLTIQEISKILNKSIIFFSPEFLKNVLKILYSLNLSPYSSEQVLFLQYRPVLDNTKLKEKFGFIPDKSSKDVFLYYLQNKNSSK